MLRLLVLALVAAGIVLAGCGGTAGDEGNASDGGGSDSDRTDLTARLPAVSLAERLAAMDVRAFRCARRKRCAPSPGDSPGAAVILGYYTQLLNLGFKCKLDRLSLEDRLSLVAGYTVKAQKLLVKQGETEGLGSIISQINGSIPYGAPRQPCSDVFDAYVTLRTAPTRGPFGA